MRKTYFLLILCCALMACKKTETDFTFSPEQPRAGQTVSFSNLSNSGEEWSWTYGDGSTSTIKSPSYIYKKPGTYQVTLKVDNKKSRICTKEITVYDTIPTYVASDSTFTIFKEYTFTANVYNPYSYPVSYLWSVDEQPIGTEKSLTIYFDQPDHMVSLALRVILNTDTTYIVRNFFVANRTTHSILMRTAEADHRQRIFGYLCEEEKVIPTNPLLNEEQDTIQKYNDSIFRLSELEATFPGIEGFHIAHRKIYYRADGLWVAHIDGTNAVQIEDDPCTAMTLDLTDNRVYWATEEGVMYMPFIGADNNQFVTVPAVLNVLQNVTKLAADAEYR